MTGPPTTTTTTTTRGKGSFPMNADTREPIKNKNNASRARMAAKTGFDKDAARAVYMQNREISPRHY